MNKSVLLYSTLDQILNFELAYQPCMVETGAISGSDKCGPLSTHTNNYGNDPPVESNCGN